MFKKNHILILLSLIFSIFISGCSMNSLGLLNELEKAQSISLNNATQTVNTISISNLSLPEELDESSKSYQDFINNNYINITQKYNPTTNVSSIFVDSANKINNKREHIITLKFKDNAFSVSFGNRIKNLLSKDADSKVIVEAIDNKIIPLYKVSEIFGEDITSPTSMMNMLSNQDSLKQLNQKSMKFLKEFISIYRDLKPDVISREGNAYVLYFDNEDFVMLLDSFVKLSINNYQELITATASFYDSLTDEEFNTIYNQGYSLGTKEEFVEMINELAKEELPTDLITQWNEIYKNDISPIISNSLKDSSFRMRMWNKNNKFYTNTYAKLKVTSPYDPSSIFSMDILSKQYTETINNDFDIQLPNILADFDALELN